MRTQYGDVICYTAIDGYTVYKQYQFTIQMVGTSFLRNKNSEGRSYRFSNYTKPGVKHYNSNTWEKLI